jgi:site-specific DNA-methyltransferase (adenine-specific)
MKLINSDCIIAMKEMPDNSVDSIVTDPPYELGFMGKSWDSTGIANSVEMWSQALRVLKPGGHLIAFSGSRTYHRMAVAIEDAGFEIRDQIMWVYGSGFPKSMDISKAIDKAAGVQPIDLGESPNWRESKRNREVNGQMEVRGENAGRVTTPASDAAKQWQGWGTALKPAHEPMVLARKPIVGTVANNVMTYGVGGLNIDGSRVAGKLEGDPNRFAKTDGGNFVMGGLPDAPVVRSEGRFPANFIHDGSDEVVNSFPETKATGSGKVSGFRKGGDSKNSVGISGVKSAADGFSDSGSAARFFYCAKTSKADRNEGLDEFERKAKIFNGQSDKPSGNAKGSVEDKFSTQPSANNHPTVKPTELMRYLVRLITPPEGTVLDPFMGSGSTGKACAYEGFDFIGIDQSAEYVEIARARIEFALHQEETKEMELPF